MDRLVLGETRIVPASRKLHVTYGGAVLEDIEQHGLVCFLEREMVEAIQANWPTHRPIIDMEGKLVLEPIVESR